MVKSRSDRKKKIAAAAATLPDRRLLEALLAALGADKQGDSDLERAQDLIYDAWDAPDRRRRVALAKKALAISPLCADAYSILAQEAQSPDEAVALYRQGVDAGEHAIGETAFTEDVGHFWGLFETRPYMRARHGLALALWAEGGDAREEAVTHLWDMLRLNPNDNQGVRYILLNCLLELGRDEDAATLRERYAGDGAAYWLYSEALAVFRASGDCAASRAALAQVIKSNRHVPDYLWGRKRMPRTAPGVITMGGEDEAIAYAQDGGAAWAASPGALQWAAAAAQSAPRARRRGFDPT
jgi:hypothetical protein